MPQNRSKFGAELNSGISILYPGHEYPGYVHIQMSTCPRRRPRAKSDE